MAGGTGARPPTDVRRRAWVLFRAAPKRARGVIRIVGRAAAWAVEVAVLLRVEPQVSQRHDRRTHTESTGAHLLMPRRRARPPRPAKLTTRARHRCVA